MTGEWTVCSARVVCIRSPRNIALSLGPFQGRSRSKSDWAGPGPKVANALFTCEKILDFATIALSFVCDKYCSIID